MRPIILVMFLVDLGIILATAYGVSVRAPTPDRRRPVWSSFVLSLLVGGSTSTTIANDHLGKPGSDILAFVGAAMVGMAVMGALVAVRERRLGQAAPPA